MGGLNISYARSARQSFQTTPVFGVQTPPIFLTIDGVRRYYTVTKLICREYFLRKRTNGNQVVPTSCRARYTFMIVATVQQGGGGGGGGASPWSHLTSYATGEGARNMGGGGGGRQPLEPPPFLRHCIVRYVRTYVRSTRIRIRTYEYTYTAGLGLGSASRIVAQYDICMQCAMRPIAARPDRYAVTLGPIYLIIIIV